MAVERSVLILTKSVKLPIGIDDFEKIRTEGFYYVDKTGLIKELLNNWGKVNLFTRPRRFGKSLNMSMLKYFFEYGCDSRLFEGLAILLGLLSHREDWIIDSNAESGDGFSDILIEIEESNTGIVIEIKYADDGNLENGCKRALAQIEERGYAERLLRDGMNNIVKYGIACYKKACKASAQI